MVTVQRKKTKPQPLYFEGPSQSIRANCKEVAFFDGTGKTWLGSDYIDLVMVASDIMLGPLPSIDPDKLRDTDGPLQYQQGNSIKKLSQASDQEIAEAVYTHLIKVRGFAAAFITPSSYASLSPDGQAVINQKLILTTNFHGVSVERASGGFATYLFNLVVAGKASYEVITRVWFDGSHKSANGDIIQGLFFQPVEPETEEDKAFLETVSQAIDGSDQDINVPIPSYMNQCVSFANYYQDKDKIPLIKAGMLNSILGNHLTFDSSLFVKEAVYGLSGVAPIMLDGETEVETLEAEVAPVASTRNNALTETIPF
jgi:hypothetical protein